MVSFGGSIPDVLLDELIEDGRTEVANDSISNNRPTANRSARRIPQTQSITLSNGERKTLRQIEGNTSVYCPYHYDTQPRAFVAQSRSGRYLHCSTCKMTWWMAGPRKPNSKLHSFDDTVIALNEGVIQSEPEGISILEQAMGETRLLPNNIIIANERYLNPHNLKLWDLSNGVTFVKSPKGTGKTTFLAGLLKQATTRFATLEDFEAKDDIDEPEPWYTNQKVLLIGHRQALIG